MTQNAVPSADVSAGSWTTAPLWSKVDEIPASDTDFIALANNTTGACRVGTLKTTGGGAISDPFVHTNHVLRMRGKRTGSKTTTIVTSLYQGTTLIASFSQNLASSFTDYSYTLTETQAGNITNYTDLRIDVNCSASGSNNAPNISAVSLDVPDVAAINGSLSKSLDSLTQSLAGAVAIAGGVNQPLGGCGLVSVR